MRRNKFIAVALVFLLGCGPAGAATKAAGKKPPAARPAPQITAQGTYGAWRVFQGSEEQAPVCFMQSAASKASKLPKRGAPTLTISWRPLENAYDVVSYAAGGIRLRAGQPVDLRIGEKNWRLFSTSWSAWARDSHTDHDIVAAMKAGTAPLQMSAQTERNQQLRDEFSLQGVTAAWQKMAQLCSIKLPPPGKPPRAFSK